MKHLKITLIAISIILVGVVFLISFWPKVNMKFATKCKTIFKYGEKNISQTMLSDDFANLCDLFEGKRLYREDLSCGFSDNISIIVDDCECFSFACDSCPIIYWKNKNKFFKLSENEYDRLTEILGKYGFSFPCL